VLVLTASVGEGHDRPAYWLARQIEEERPDAVVSVEDSLVAMGKAVAAFSESGPRLVFFRVQWL
jgi:hypothetical protein